MNIIKASPEELVEVLYLLKVCVQEMNSKGWFHWDLQSMLVKEDVEQGKVFLFREDESSVGAITLCTEFCDEYKSVNWSSSIGKALIVHRLIVHPNWRNQGIGKELLAFSEKYAQENEFTSIRFDVFSENTEAVGLCNQLKYKQMGEILYQYQKTPYYCFEKNL